MGVGGWGRDGDDSSAADHLLKSIGDWMGPLSPKQGGFVMDKLRSECVLNALLAIVFCAFPVLVGRLDLNYNVVSDRAISFCILGVHRTKCFLDFSVRLLK